MRIEDKTLNSNANNLTFARLVLASSVLYSHCLWQVTGSDQDHLARYLGAPISNFAVDGFFFLSGFLVYRSLCLKPDIKRFVLARFARLWPGLMGMIVIVSLIGIAISVETPIRYAALTLKGFIASNLTFISPVYTLSGVYCGYDLCNVNGSLWTIPWEVRCYAILSLLFVAGFATPRAMARYVLPLSTAFAAVNTIPVIQFLIHAALPSFAAYYVVELDRLWTAFAIGMAAYLVHRSIPLKWSVLLALVVVDLLVHQFIPGAGLHVRTILAAYLTLTLGFLSAKRFGPFSANWPDYSYGMYIYAFPIMIALYSLGIHDLVPLLISNFCLTLIVAAGSWHWVEKPALAWLKSFSKADKRVLKSA